MSSFDGFAKSGAAYKLFIPGPVPIAPDVHAELSRPIVPHYGPEWTELYNKTANQVCQLLGTAGNSYLIPGSGSAGLDAGIGTFFKPGDRILIPDNGFFAERLIAIAESHGLEVESFSVPLGKPVLPEEIKQAIDRTKDLKGVAIVHCETSSGVLNPIKEIASISKTHGLIVMVDAVSSFGGVAIDMDRWGIDIVVSASQKALGAPAGLAIVAVGSELYRELRQMAQGKKSGGWYLNLAVWEEYADKWGDWHPFPVTLPTSNVLALQRAISDAIEETMEAREARHFRVAELFRQGLNQLGFSLVADAEFASPTVTAVYSGGRTAAIQDYLKTHWSILIAGGMGHTKQSMFRVGHMGATGYESEVRLVLGALEDYQRAYEQKTVAG